jgi:hypothetical protein
MMDFLLDKQMCELAPMVFNDIPPEVEATPCCHRPDDAAKTKQEQEKTARYYPPFYINSISSPTYPSNGVQISDIQNKLQEMRNQNPALMQKNNDLWKHIELMSQINLTGNTSDLSQTRSDLPHSTDDQNSAANGLATGGMHD